MEMYVACVVIALAGSAMVVMLRIRERRQRELLSGDFIRRNQELIGILLRKYPYLNIDESNPEAVALAGASKRRQVIFHIAEDNGELLVSWYFRSVSAGEHCLVWTFALNSEVSRIAGRLETDIRQCREQLLISRNSSRPVVLSSL
jgi:hypothetical protein